MKITMNETASYELPPNGEYDALIKSAEDRVSRSGKNMIELKVKLLGVNGDYVLNEYLVEGAYLIENAARVLKSCGYDPKQGEEVDNNTFVGRKARVRIAAEPDGNGVSRLRIKHWIPRPKVEENKEDIPF